MHVQGQTRFMVNDDCKVGHREALKIPVWTSRTITDSSPPPHAHKNTRNPWSAFGCNDVDVLRPSLGETIEDHRNGCHEDFYEVGEAITRETNLNRDGLLETIGYCDAPKFMCVVSRMSILSNST
jgi:hypothetical protein